MSSAPTENVSRHESLTGSVGLDFPQYDDPPPDPLPLLRQWLDAATEDGVREPRSMALATADERGRASNRIVTLGELTGRGLVFTTHSTSRKGRDLAANGWASAVLYWRERSQQVVVTGPVRQLGPQECDALWSARPAALHPMTSASHQSEPVHDTERLRARARGLGRTGAPLPRPARFVGYLLEPAELEFWSASPDRLHRRLHYARDGARWRTGRLQP